ncbi:ABC superfamily ATP binding cassette transporter, ABC protein [Bifidobacterium merycicum]|uniref:ABC superfamily ATP binding cassette transporter, ABC protein n=2 Tax=Bifidobacterium merycicum TaxID=78345 RepID=A0A087BID1_9BIFI|nr:ABC superfamily ATP binding cassette transporter, ABC protein [Bifidobacterium merycicum]SHE32294.1 D-methionine transport system ATP-binding protein [Bifidobacterium merycicum DSM 6492]
MHERSLAHTEGAFRVSCPRSTRCSCKFYNGVKPLNESDGMTEQTPIISFDHVVKEFKQAGKAAKTTRAVDDVSLTINAGDIFGIIGYSGAGKSTLVRLINALEKPTSGTVTVLGTEVSSLSEAKLRPIRQKIGMIFQQFNLFSTKTVAQNIAYPLQLDHWRKDYQERRVKQLLEFVGLGEHANKYPSQLSGGQKQRVGIARALATNPKILLADEATSALDPETTTEVLSLLKRVNEELGITIVVITHQMNVVQQIANRVAVMSSGKVVEQGDVYDVFAAPRQQVTKRFIATALNGVPDEDRVARMREQWAERLVTVLIRQRDVKDGETITAASGQNISTLIAKHGVDSSLLYGGIDTVRGSAIGAVTYGFKGDGLDAFLRELKENSDIVDFGTAAEPVPYAQAVARADGSNE